MGKINNLLAELKQRDHIIGKLHKKVADQQLLIKEKEKIIKEYEDGSKELSLLTDALIIHMALNFGIEKFDPDNKEELVGWTLNLPKFNAIGLRQMYDYQIREDDTTESYKIHVTWNKDGDENG